MTISELVGTHHPTALKIGVTRFMPKCSPPQAGQRPFRPGASIRALDTRSLLSDVQGRSKVVLSGCVTPVRLLLTNVLGRGALTTIFRYREQLPKREHLFPSPSKFFGKVGQNSGGRLRLSNFKPRRRVWPLPKLSGRAGCQYIRCRFERCPMY